MLGYEFDTIEEAKAALDRHGVTLTNVGWEWNRKDGTDADVDLFMDVACGGETWVVRIGRYVGVEVFIDDGTGRSLYTALDDILGDGTVIGPDPDPADEVTQAIEYLHGHFVAEALDDLRGAFDRSCIALASTVETRPGSDALTSYVVDWAIDIDAGSPQEAARKALATMRDPDSTATCFVVGPIGAKPGERVLVDLDDGEG